MISTWLLRPRTSRTAQRAIAQRFSAMALSVISLLRSDSVAFGCEADMRTVERATKAT